MARLGLLGIVLLLAIGAAASRVEAQEPTSITVEAGGQVVLADFTTTAAETFTTVTSITLWDGEAWSTVYRPSTGNTDFPIKPGTWLWIVSPGAQTITIAAPPPPPGPSPGGAPDPTAGSCAFVDGAAHVAASTAQVLTPYSTGTAFYIGDDEWMTAAHVVAEGGRIRLRTETHEVTAAVIGRDDAADLALLRASGTSMAPLEFSDYDALRLGETLGAAGYPDIVTGSPSVSAGLLSKFVTYEGIAYIQTSAEISPGNSGGPLFTVCGHVAGVNVAKIVGPAIEGIGFAVTIPTIQDRLPRLRAGVGRGSPPSTPSEGKPLEITAVCSRQRDEAGEWQDFASSDDCRAAAVDGLHVGWGWWGSMWMRGVETWDNLIYRFDGGETVAHTERNRAMERLAPGRHTVEVGEQRGEQWTGWSAPYSFTIVRELEIVAVCHWQWDEEAGGSKPPETAADCSVWGMDGIRIGSPWIVSAWIRGEVDFENVVYRFDGGAAVPWAQKHDVLDLLSPGPHTLEVREQHLWGWTEWSAPYSFTVLKPQVRLLAVCNQYWDAAAGEYQGYEAATDCHHAAQAEGIDPFERMTYWGWYVGDDWSNIYWMVDDSGQTLTEEEFWRALDRLPPGRHSLRIIEWLPAAGAWTAWSDPYEITIKLVLLAAVCNAADSFWGCYLAGQAGIDRRDGLTLWALAVLNYDNVTYRLNGEEMDAGAVRYHIWYTLGQGNHTLEMGERRPWGWTGWSPPFTFAIR